MLCECNVLARQYSVFFHIQEQCSTPTTVLAAITELTVCRLLPHAGYTDMDIQGAGTPMCCGLALRPRISDGS